MTKSYLEGEIDSMFYCLDFPYELECRYKKIVREDRAMAELIYDCLVEEGVNLYEELTEDEFKEKIQKEYQFVLDAYQGNIDIL